MTKATPQLMSHLDTKRVTSVSCGRNFVIALGQTLLNTGNEELMPLSQSVDTQPERDSCVTISGRYSRSQNREDHPSPLRTKLRKKSSGHRSTGRLGGRELEKVHGNRHVGGCCGHEKVMKPRPPSSRSPRHKKKQRQIVISPSRRHEKLTAEREEEFSNYRSLVE